jgi:hypothetical protein
MTVSEHNLFYYPYASFTNAQLLLFKAAMLYFDKLVILDPAGASWDAIGADYPACHAVGLLKDASVLEFVTPATVLAKYEARIAEAIRRDTGLRLHTAAERVVHLSADAGGATGRTGDRYSKLGGGASLGRFPVRELSLQPPDLSGRLLSGRSPRLVLATRTLNAQIPRVARRGRSYPWPIQTLILAGSSSAGTSPQTAPAVPPDGRMRALCRTPNLSLLPPEGERRCLTMSLGMTSK